MKNIAANNTVRSEVLQREDLREIYYRELMAQRRERLRQEALAAEAAQERGDRLQSLWRRLNYDPASAEQNLREKIETSRVSERSLKRRAEWEEGKRLEQNYSHEEKRDGQHK